MPRTRLHPTRRASLAATVVALGLFGGCSLVRDLDALSSVAADASSHDASDASLPGDDGSTGDDSATDAVSDAASGDAGATDGDAGVADSGCRGTAGPAMVRVGTYCIDSTEVTAAHYYAFIGAVAGNTSGQPAECAFNTTFVPTKSFPADSLPVRYIDWCDAFAYCKWAGKRLCGAIGGGQASFNQSTAPTDAWYMACSQNSARLYPYGPTYDPNACNGVDSNQDAGDVIAVGSKAGCVGGFPGLFDMSGNAREWEDACLPGDGGGAEECLLRGGSANMLANDLECTDTSERARSYTSDHVGFRCCSQ